MADYEDILLYSLVLQNFMADSKRSWNIFQLIYILDLNGKLSQHTKRL